MSSWVIRIGIVAAIVIGGFVLRDRLSSNAGELKVGDCFDDPGAVAEVSDVQHHPCSEAHTGEVVFVGDMTGDNSAYPSDDTILTFVSASCLPAFTSYTGKAYDGQVLDVGYLHPTKEGWGGGDRGVICYAYNIDGSTQTGSVKVH